jgi:hypothetical protein
LAEGRKGRRERRKGKKAVGGKIPGTDGDNVIEKLNVYWNRTATSNSTIHLFILKVFITSSYQ